MKIGTKTADKVEELGRTSLRKLQEWSKEDPNAVTDDALRLIGGGLKNVGRVASLPGIKQGLQLADAPFHYLAKGAGKAAGAAGIDPRWGEWLVRTGELATGVGVGKKALKKTGKLAQASADDIASLMMRQNPMFAGSGGGGLGGPGGNLKKQLGMIEAQNAINAIKAKNLKKPSRSTLATVTSDTADKLHYGKGTKEVKATIPKELGGQKGSLTEIKGIPNKQFHHIFIKDLSAEYVETARTLVREGKALPEDVIDLDRITKKYGFGLGDYRSAGDYIDKIPHNEGHDLLIKKGIQPDAKGIGPDLVTEKSRISKYKNIKELKKDFELAVKEIAVPMREEMLDFQEAWDKITPGNKSKLIELRLKRGAMRKKYGTETLGKHDELDKATKAYSKHKSKLMNELHSNKEMMLGQREALADLKIDRLNPPQ